MYVLLGLMLIVLGFVGFLVLVWFLYVPVIARVSGETPWLQANSLQPLDDAEQCQFHTADGMVLRGSYLRATAALRQGVIVFCHELAGDRWGAVPYVRDLRERGFDVFTFDFRNHGSSDSLPEYRPMPWLTRYEVADVQAAINYVFSRPGVALSGIGLIGVSKGGNAALCAAATDPRVQAVVTDGAFPIDAMQRHYIRRFMRIYARLPRWVENIPDFCLLSFCAWAKFLLGLRSHCRFVNVDQVARQVRQPVFMIHGEQDGYIPLHVVRKLRTYLSGRSKLWIVPGVKHNGAIAAVTAEYHRRIARFFQKTLGQKTAPGRRPHTPRISRQHGVPERVGP
jgi:pimeloyl-ACP methyl ester carboxylesterase